MKSSVTFKWPTYRGDFLPYNAASLDDMLDNPETATKYTTGMYSSRPNFKKTIRDFNAYVQSSLTFYAIDILKDKNSQVSGDIFG